MSWQDTCESKVETVPYSRVSLPFVMTVAEVAKLLGVGKNTTYTLIRDGVLSSVRVGRQIRVSRETVLRYLGVVA